LIDLYAPLKTHSKNDNKNYNLLDTKQLLTELISLLLKQSSRTKILKKIVKGDHQESNLLFLEYFLEHRELDKRDLNFMGKILKSSLNKKNYQIVKLLLKHKIDGKISKKYYLKILLLGNSEGHFS
jgi:hypothetical protein